MQLSKTIQGFGMPKVAVSNCAEALGAMCNPWCVSTNSVSFGTFKEWWDSVLDVEKPRIADEVQRVTMAVDIDGDGVADMLVTGVDLDGDGIVDMLQVRRNSFTASSHSTHSQHSPQSQYSFTALTALIHSTHSTHSQHSQHSFTAITALIHSTHNTHSSHTTTANITTTAKSEACALSVMERCSYDGVCLT